jgi:hypothetical protein
MASVDWAHYAELCDRMWDQRDSWADATSLQTLTESVQRACPELLDGDQGLGALEEALATDLSDDEAFERVRLAALSRPAGEYGYDAGYEGYYLSQNAAGETVYAATRFAGPSEWGVLAEAAVVYPGEATPEAEAGADAAPQLDPATNRWRRREEESGELEYFDSDDNVWERAGDHGLWRRHHEGTGQWLPHDKASRTWLVGDQWVTSEQLGGDEAARSGAQVDPALEQAVARSLEEAFELTPGAESLSPDEIEAILAEVLVELKP